MLASEALRAVDATFEAFAAGAGGPPGVAWGVIAGGELVHAGSRGTLRVGEDRPPDASSIFRIASMTKSFTAAAILLLRDEGRLALDDPVARHVPELVALSGPTSDSPPVTIRHLLTMSAGFPTDDPLGDRLQAMPMDAFTALLGAGISFAWPPDTAFEYSNLGYGILGRVITNVTGREYREVVEERLLQPLGMAVTTYLPEQAPDHLLARGYVRRDERWELEPLDGYGALAAMGGILTSVEDLARWVAGFTDAFPARDDPEVGHPLTRASRREMQRVHRDVRPELTHDGTGAPPRLVAGGYGMGLFALHDLEIGTTVGHGGGYPGFGSHMRWHPGTGLGVVAMANARYARVHGPTEAALRALVRSGEIPPRRVRPAPATERLRGVADRLLVAWDDSLADEMFAPNMDLDEPREVRRTAAARAVERLGPLVPDDEAARSDSPAHCAWWLRGERGRLKVELLATGEPVPRIQALWVDVVPDPSPDLLRLAECVAGLLALDPPRWPDDVSVASGTDVVALERGLRAAAVLLGPVTLGRPTAGDAERALTVEVRGERGDGSLRLEVDASGAIVRAAIVPSPAAAPVEAP
jgi:CubicO group peptidase (beta-lactamase class C family)